MYTDDSKLTFLENTVKINFESMNSLSLALVNRHGPCQDKRATEAIRSENLQTNEEVVPTHSCTLLAKSFPSASSTLNSSRLIKTASDACPPPCTDTRTTQEDTVPLSLQPFPSVLNLAWTHASLQHSPCCLRKKR